jgi:type II secretory pathway pseudopilin PulG
MNKHVDGVRFYIGHELGHLRMKHLSGHLLRWPVLWLPLLGAAYSRARESTCDRHGLACSSTPEGAARALAALSAGAERWQDLNVAAYRKQANQSSGFWMSFHELTAGYPWLTKRVARVMAADDEMPKRSAFAYLMALVIPYAGRLGGGFGFLILIYVVGVLAAVAIPAYQDYVARAKFIDAFASSQPARDTLARIYLQSHQIPESLAAASVASVLPSGDQMSLDAKGMVLTVTSPPGALIFTPKQTAEDRIVWTCTGGYGARIAHLPPACRPE